jgi:glyoxylase-like metal-dependent hydrolase (beta-lactamase superfamily II)
MFAQGRGGQAAREITQTRGDLYYVSVGANTVFLVTPDGIILGDPVSTEQATWLKPELERRFNKPVRYIIYSHHDFDHAEGAAVFGPAAHVIAHENVAKNLDGRLHRLAGGNVDSNNNGKLDRDEASGGYLTNFDRLDRNHDGAITPAELNQEIRKPDITYTGRRTLTLGGKTVQLIYPARNHSDDMTVMYFPAERAVLAVDFIFPGTTPPVWAEYDWTPLREWIASIKTVEALDFDILIPGHGRRLGTRADVVANREFLEDVSCV